MFERFKKKVKRYILIAIPMYLLSLYMTLIYKHFLIYKHVVWGLKPLFQDIRNNGFPFKSSIIVFVVLIGCCIFLYLHNKNESCEEDERNFKYSNSGVYGTAGLLTEEELKGYCKIETAKHAKGVILGQMDESGTRIVNTDMDSRMNRHVAVFGASGCGKSRCYARPFIINAVKRRESIIVTDPKGELYESTAQYLKDNGYVVKILDLVHPEKSDGWNILKELRGEELRAQILADVIIRNTGASDKGDIWDTSAMSLLKALMLRVERGHDFKKNNKQNIGSAYELIQNPDGEKYLDSVFDVMTLTKDEKCCIGPYMTFKQASDNMRGNIITGLATRLQVFQNEVIRKMTAVDDIDLTLPAKRPCAYYCIMSDQHGALNFLSSLFFTALFMDLVEYADMNGGQCPIPVNFLLDEFPNIGSIPDFEKKIATVRSRGINISIIFQGITQLQERYPFGKWTGILGNCDTHLFLGCNEPETAKFISDRTGEATIKVKTEQHEKLESLFQIGRRHSTGDGKRKIMTPDEIMRLPQNEELIILRSKNVLKAYKYDFSLHPEAQKFRTISIQDRPSITDDEGRRQYAIQEERYIQEYERKNAEIKKNSSAKTVTASKKLFGKMSRRFKKPYHFVNANKRIKPKGDIELTLDDYQEIELECKENEIVEADEIEIMDEYKADGEIGEIIVDESLIGVKTEENVSETSGNEESININAHVVDAAQNITSDNEKEGLLNFEPREEKGSPVLEEIFEKTLKKLRAA